ncbi:hypothetical protein [Chishuiella sp.]|uniref:hypothetical protein n=1 Tax=Chishuiella sp. TaxID=1969467 RepID=UPI0028A8D49D|nr:hypothetical protein [Chishuiella sp.]
MSQNISELNLTSITNEKLVHFINYQLPITNKDLKEILLKEFKNRNLEYRHLYNFQLNELDIKNSLHLIDDCLFEKNIPKPPLVGNFYPIVRRLKNFLMTSEELKGKRLKTFDYIFDQLFLADDFIEIISEDKIQELNENDVFITFKNKFQQFPNQNVLKRITLKSSIIVIDKDNYYKGYKRISIHKDNSVIKELILA